MGDDAGMRLLLPVGRSGYAIIAGYLGLFSLIVIPGPLALIFGVLALRDIKKQKNSAYPKHGAGRAWFGIVMGAIATILILIFLVSALTGGGPEHSQ